MSADSNGGSEPCWRKGCDEPAEVLLRESPPGNPYRDVECCEPHAEEMVASGFYFVVGPAGIAVKGDWRNLIDTHG